MAQSSSPAYKAVKYFLRFLMTLSMNLYAIPAYLVWMLALLPLKIIHWKLYWAVESFIFNGLLAMVVTWLYTGSYTIVETGDDVSSLYDKKIILLANHQSTADVPVVMTAIQPKTSVGGRVMWIMDLLFKYTNFGVVSVVRGDFFIRQGKHGRQGQLENLKKHIVQSYIPTDKKWIVIFPEGGFLRKRRAASKQYAKKNDYPVLEHVTLPRSGALQAVLDILNPTEDGKKFTLPDGTKKELVEWIIDLTIAYPKAEPLDLQGICIGWRPPCNILLQYKAYKVKDIPRDSEGLLKWLYDRFTEKEAYLDAYYSTGKIPSEPRTTGRPLTSIHPHPLQHDLMGVALYHVFYIISTYLHYTLLYKPILNLIL